MELKTKTKIYFAISFVNMILFFVFVFVGSSTGVYTTLIIAIIFGFLLVKEGPPQIPEEGEGLLYRYFRLWDRHPIMLTLVFANAIFAFITVQLIYSGGFEWGPYLFVIVICEGCALLGIYIGKCIKDKKPLNWLIIIVASLLLIAVLSIGIILSDYQEQQVEADLGKVTDEFHDLKKSLSKEMPPQTKAIETVENFLEMCKLGQLGDAYERYGDSRSTYGYAYPAALDNVSAYHVSYTWKSVLVPAEVSWEGKAFLSPYVIAATIQTTSGGTFYLRFCCSSGGEKIYYVDINPDGENIPTQAL